MIARASSRNSRPWLIYQKADATSLPFDNDCFDVVVSTQVAEYIHNIDAFCSEVMRVLRPRARGLVLATDWDSVCWHSSDPGRMKRILEAFAPHCADSRLPRTLAVRLRNVGLIVENVSYFPIINLDRYNGCYSEMAVPFIAAYVRAQGTVPERDLRAWADDLRDLNARGEHFFSSGRFSFLVKKPANPTA
jgi:arsenite methyltransferase